MNIIDTIRVSGTDYTLSATSSGGITSGEVQTMIDESVSGITERMAEDEEVTAAALNNLNDRISGISGNNVVEVTQAEYDALVSGGTVDPTAFYIITDAQAGDLTQYWTSAQTNSAINAAVSGKQDTLSAGTGISIVDNIISATGGGSITIDPSLDSGSTNAVANSAITNAINSKQDSSKLPTYIVCSVTFSNNQVSVARTAKFNGGTFSTANNVITINNQAIFNNSNLTNLSLVETSAITTTITSSSTDAQVPSAKAVYDKIGDINTILESI